MNALESYIQETGKDWKEVMNTLQDHKIISDNCITPAEVGDSLWAAEWLRSINWDLSTNY